MNSRMILPWALWVVAAVSNSCAPSGGGSPQAAFQKSSELAAPGAEGATKDMARSGLGTSWGDERKSTVTQRAFVRAAAKPAGMDAIYYNDPEGVKAMASEKQRVAGLQTAAGGLVSWGIKGAIGFLPSYKEFSSERRFIVGKKNGSYRIVVKNNSQRSLEIVASVDGLDVTDGRTASVSKRGYIVEGGKQLEIEGFRTSNSAIAAFKFGSVENSYANLRHGETRNVGVIGIAVFTRKLDDESRRRDAAQPFAVAP